VGSVGFGRLVWPGMVLAGLGLGLAVLAAWPEPTTRVVRLPYGESQPKTPSEAVAVRAPAAKAARSTPAAVVPPVAAPPLPAPAETAEAEEVGRVLAVAEPAPEPAPADGPPPVPSEAEVSGGYQQESPEELGARPLPGADLTLPPPPVAG
jgi:hypothetical protein